MKSGEEGLVDDFLSPNELWDKTFPKSADTDIAEVWREKFANVPFEDKKWKLAVEILSGNSGSAYCRSYCTG